MKMKVTVTVKAVTMKIVTVKVVTWKAATKFNQETDFSNELYTISCDIISCLFFLRSNSTSKCEHLC